MSIVHPIEYGSFLHCIKPDFEPATASRRACDLDFDWALTRLNVPPGAVTTSSITKRKWMQAEAPRHHLIDPRTGEPAETDWLSVTVIAPHTDLSEVFAKALLIAGSQEADVLARNAPEISYLAVDREGKI